MAKTFTVVTNNKKYKGDYGQLIPPLMAKVRYWGDGKEIKSMLSLPTEEFQAYFDEIDKLKERLGFTTEHDRLQALADLVPEILKPNDDCESWYNFCRYCDPDFENEINCLNPDCPAVKIRALMEEPDEPTDEA